MPSNKLKNYLRTYRMRAYLSQDEVAFLLGSEDGIKVSRYERFLREPSLETALALEAIFGIPARELFAGVYQKVEGRVQERARLLARRLNDQAISGRIAARKLEALQAIDSGPGTGSAQQTGYE